MLLAFLLLFLFLVLLLNLFLISAFVSFILTRVPFISTDFEDINLIIKKLNIKNEDIFYDLGSGDGKVLFKIEKLTGAKVVGYELGLWICTFSKLKAFLIGSKAEFYNKNFFKQNWSQANFIYCYLFPPLMQRLEEKFLKDCKPGTIAIIRDFPFPNLTYTEKYSLPKMHQIYIYRK